MKAMMHLFQSLSVIATNSPTQRYHPLLCCCIVMSVSCFVSHSLPTIPIDVRMSTFDDGKWTFLTFPVDLRKCRFPEMRK